MKNVITMNCAFEMMESYDQVTSGEIHTNSFLVGISQDNQKPINLSRECLSSQYCWPKTTTDELEEYLSVDILPAVQNLGKYYDFDGSLFLSSEISVVFREFNRLPRIFNTVERLQHT